MFETENLPGGWKSKLLTEDWVDVCGRRNDSTVFSWVKVLGTDCVLHFIKAQPHTYHPLSTSPNPHYNRLSEDQKCPCLLSKKWRTSSSSSTVGNLISKEESANTHAVHHYTAAATVLKRKISLSHTAVLQEKRRANWRRRAWNSCTCVVVAYFSFSCVNLARFIDENLSGALQSCQGSSISIAFSRRLLLGKRCESELSKYPKNLTLG